MSPFGLRNKYRIQASERQNESSGNKQLKAVVLRIDPGASEAFGGVFNLQLGKALDDASHLAAVVIYYGWFQLSSPLALK